MPIKKISKAVEDTPPEPETDEVVEDPPVETSEEDAGIGHNGGPVLDDEPARPSRSPYSVDPTVSMFIQRLLSAVAALDEEKKEISGAISDKWAEAKGFGLDTKALKEVYRRMKQDPDQRAELDQLIDLYTLAAQERV